MDTVAIPKALARMLYTKLKEAIEADDEDPPTIPFRPKPLPGTEPRRPPVGFSNPWDKKKLTTDPRWSDTPFPDRHGWTVTC
jgi:hypothetical protein